MTLVMLDSRATSGVGRDARLALAFDAHHGRTRLAASYAEPPFRIPRGFPDLHDGGRALHAILASSAPGVFGGDCFTQSIHVASGAQVRLTSQSATQMHPSPAGDAAVLKASYRVASAGHLHCAWDPSIPFAGARIDQRIEIDLAKQATLFWSDAIMSGREACGERWAFASVRHELRIARDDHLVYLERYAVEPANRPTSNAWITADSCYFGTVLIVGPAAGAPAAGVHAAIAHNAAVHAAVDQLEDDVVLIRVASASGPPFHAVRRRLAAIAGSG
jgi:urease accessory protein